MRKNAAAAHADRIGRVTRYILDHLDDPLPLTKLAEVACFSPHHFHRIYRGVLGETTDQTVRRLRLHRAAVDLLSAQTPIAQVAKRAGYSSAEAFSRAFSSSYGCPPTRYRAERAPVTGPPGAPEFAIMYDVTIDDLPALRLAGYPHKGPYDQISAVFERLAAWAGPRGLITPETCFYGAYYDDPASVAAGELRSFAGITVSEGQALDDDLERLDYPAGRAAKLVFKGPYAELEKPYGYLYGQWLPKSGREPTDMPCLERYLNDPRETAPPDLLTEIILPLAA